MFKIVVATLPIFAEEHRFSDFSLFLNQHIREIPRNFAEIELFKDFDKGYSKIMIFQSNLRNLLNFRRNSVQNFVPHRFQKSGDWETVLQPNVLLFFF